MCCYQCLIRVMKVCWVVTLNWRALRWTNFKQKQPYPSIFILKASNFFKIKNKEAPKFGKTGDPIAELTNLGWIIISPKKESNYYHLLLKPYAFNSFEELCSLGVLDISKKEDVNNELFLNKFKSELLKKEGFYETVLI